MYIQLQKTEIQICSNKHETCLVPPQMNFEHGYPHSNALVFFLQKD